MTIHKYIETGHPHEQHGHHEMFEDFQHHIPEYGDEEKPYHHFDEHYWQDPMAQSPEEQHKSDYYWISEHHYVPETHHEHEQHGHDWGRAEIHLVDIVEPMQHYYSDPIRHEEMHLVKPVHYEEDLYIDP